MGTNRSRSGDAKWPQGRDQWGEWLDDPTGVRFRPLKPGAYLIGLSEHEQAVARELSAEPQWTVSEMTPVVKRQVGRTWAAEVPLSCATAGICGLEASGNECEPAMLTRTEVEQVAEQFGWRMPSEAEWETMCRAGRQDLFTWGDALLDNDALDAWMSWDIQSQFQQNEWGFGGLFFGEWCGDAFGHGHFPDVAHDSDALVIKGGGAQFWPWQDATEWVWCASAMRMPSTDLFEGGRAAFRPILLSPAGTDVG